MVIYPAIDLFAGQAVRLLRGDYDRMTVYSDDPPSVARTFSGCGAEWVHVVDLEGARTGGTPAFETVCAIREASNLRMEVGGGIRTMETVDRYLGAGVRRVILGTAAVKDPAFLRDALDKYGPQIAVGVDIRDGFVAISGWLEKSELEALSFCATLERWGVRTVIVTDISRDGLLGGANRELYQTLSRQSGMDLIASGGVSSLEDVAALAALGLHGAIIGKAYYTGAVDLRRAIEVAR